MDKQKIKVKEGFRPNHSIDKGIEPLSELEQKLKLLSVPYKYSAEYEFYEGKQMGLPNFQLGKSSFWDTNAGYIDKHENCGN